MLMILLILSKQYSGPLAVYKKRPDIVEQLTKNTEIAPYINKPTLYGHTPLMIAVKINCRKSVQLLLQAGAYTAHTLKIKSKAIMLWVLKNLVFLALKIIMLIQNRFVSVLVENQDQR